MTSALESFVLGAASFVLWSALALFALRLPGRLAPVVRLVGLALLVHVGTTLAALRFLDRLPYWHGAALYWCGFVFALFGYSAVYKSVSLGILAALARRPDHSLSLDEVSALYVLPGFVGRVRILVEAGLVAECEGRFRLTEAGLRLARRFALVQRLFGVARSGLYGSPVPIDAASERH
jgi:hypothetical protein